MFVQQDDARDPVQVPFHSAQTRPVLETPDADAIVCGRADHTPITPQNCRSDVAIVSGERHLQLPSIGLPYFKAVVIRSGDDLTSRRVREQHSHRLAVRLRDDGNAGAGAHVPELHVTFE